jgi:hypothetical protein
MICPDGTLRRIPGDDFKQGKKGLRLEWNEELEMARGEDGERGRRREGKMMGLPHRRNMDHGSEEEGRRSG